MASNPKLERRLKQVGGNSDAQTIPPGRVDDGGSRDPCCGR